MTVLTILRDRALAVTHVETDGAITQALVKASCRIDAMDLLVSCTGI
ncbi:hypothetical protein [Rhizobium sp. YTU87027]